MKKLLHHMLKHHDSGGNKFFLGIKGILVPIPIPMKVSIPSIKLPSISFKGDDDAGGQNDAGGEEKVKYIPVPVPVKSGGGKGWSGGGGGGGGGSWSSGGGNDWNNGVGDWNSGGGGDWNSGGGWASSHTSWTASTAEKWKGKQWNEGATSTVTNWDGGSTLKKESSQETDNDWDTEDWQKSSNDETEWDYDWR